MHPLLHKTFIVALLLAAGQAPAGQALAGLDPLAVAGNPPLLLSSLAAASGPNQAGAEPDPEAFVSLQAGANSGAISLLSLDDLVAAPVQGRQTVAPDTSVRAPDRVGLMLGGLVLIGALVWRRAQRVR